LHQGATLQLAEKLEIEPALYQGTDLSVPIKAIKSAGFNP
jgi:hypothetical protein